MQTWNPWRALRLQPHITLNFVEMPDGTRGGWIRQGERATILLDYRLDRRQRNATLAHELVHDERGLDLGPTTPVALRAKEEAIVDRLTTTRLVPLDALGAFVIRRGPVEPITAVLVGEEFDVPVETAVRALGLLLLEHAAGRWPGRD